MLIVHVGVDMDTSEHDRQIYASEPVHDLYFPVSSYNELDAIQIDVAETLCSQAFAHYETGEFLTINSSILFPWNL